MAFWKVTFFFNWGKYGWTENYYALGEGSTPAAEEANLLVDITEAALLRRKFLSEACSLEAIRAEEVDTDSGKALRSGRSALGFADFGAGGGMANGTPAAPQLGWIVNLYSGGIFGRDSRRVFRGIPRDWVGVAATLPASTPPPVELIAAWRQFFDWITGRPVGGKTTKSDWGFFSQEYTLNPGVFEMITAVAINEEGGIRRWELTVPSNSQFGPNTKVRVYGKTTCGIRGLIGDHRVKDRIALNGVILWTTVCDDCIIEYKGNLSMRGIVSTFVGYTDFAAERVAKRDTGGAFFVSRGRASAKECCR